MNQEGVIKKIIDILEKGKDYLYVHRSRGG